MRKQLGLLTSLVFLLTTAVLWMGCSRDWGCDPCCAEPCPPVCQPCAPACPAPCNPCVEQAPCCKPLPRCCHPSSNELCCRDGIIVSARNPSMCMLGDQYPLEFDIKACDDVCDVVVVTHLPEGVSFVRATPEPKV